MKEANNELKRRIFDTYSNCLVQHPCDNSGFIKYRGVRFVADVFKGSGLKPVLFGDWSGGTNPEYSAESHCDWDDCKLILKRIETISKEDAIEVAKIISPDKNISDCIDDEWQKSFVNTIGNNLAKLYPIRCLAMWDLLRFKDYDCGYFDAVTSSYIPSLIDAGYAVEKK